RTGRRTNPLRCAASRPGAARRASGRGARRHKSECSDRPSSSPSEYPIAALFLSSDGDPANMLRRFVLSSLAASGAVGGFVLMLRALEKSLIYFPSREYAVLPRDLGLRSEDVRLEAGGGALLAGWWIHGDGRQAVLFFHGNAGNISHRLERARLLVDAFGMDVLLVDYR